MNLLFGLPLFLLPGNSSTSTVRYSHHPSSVHIQTSSIRAVPLSLSLSTKIFTCHGKYLFLYMYWGNNMDSKWKISSWQHPSYWTDSSQFRGKILFLLHYFRFAHTHDWHVLSVNFENLNIRKQRLHSNKRSDYRFKYWHTPVTRNNVMYNWHTVTHWARTKKGNFLYTEQWNDEHIYRHCSIASLSVAQWRVAASFKNLCVWGIK